MATASSKRRAARCGIVAPLLWATTVIYAGSRHPEYSHVRQYVSDLAARGSSTQHRESTYIHPVVACRPAGGAHGRRECRHRSEQGGCNQLIAVSERCGAVWTTPRAPGKWSPSQIVEHVARSIEQAANMMAGAPTKFVTLPFFLRPVARMLLFTRVLRTGGFPKARTNKAMDPQSGPATPTDARVRLEGALASFDRELRARAQASDTVTSGAFGTVPVVDYARFIEIHTRHHCKQMPTAVAS